MGSHILDGLRERGIEVRVLLRRSSSTRHLHRHLPQLDLHFGSLAEPASLSAGLAGVTHVIHCAGCTKALHLAQYDQVNHQGTRRLIQAVNQHDIRRLVFISSLAASRPALRDHPARESDAPAPVSAYGRSKLAAERAVQQECHSDFAILRPAAVYGPRDADFLILFKAVRARLLPLIRGGQQPVSLVFVKDLADAALRCLTEPRAAGGVYNIASPRAVTGRELALEIAGQMKVRLLVLPMSWAILWLLCCGQEGWARCTGKPRILSRQKYHELRAPGWVCDPSRAQTEMGFTASTGLHEGIAETLAWYRQEHWL